MEKILSACGNDCSLCPRHLPKSEEELRKTASLWYEIGYRDHVASTEEIGCKGCSVDAWCRYGIVGCVKKQELENCGQCKSYPCGKVLSAFVQTKRFEPRCKECCDRKEYERLAKAFFEKKENLDCISGKGKG